ncbi:MAG: RNA methyltransferase [Thermodesulfovibrionales bacterium]|nr:RNA methyltransferase [Thermodesulfovibrionales bacterium]
MEERYKVITSLSNTVIKETLKIKKRLYKRSKTLLIEGPHLIESAIFSPFAQIRRIFLVETFMATVKFKKLLPFLSDIEKILVTSDVLYTLADTESPQGIVAVVNYDSKKLEELEVNSDFLVVLCDGIQDPGNLGTIIRASAAYDAKAVVVLPNTCDPFNPKTLRSTAGGIFQIPIVFADYEQILSFLHTYHIPLFVATVGAEKLIFEIDFTHSLAVAFGNEVRGVNRILQRASLDAFKIPISERIESLNVAMAASICLYEIYRQRYANKT